MYTLQLAVSYPVALLSQYLHLITHDILTSWSPRLHDSFHLYGMELCLDPRDLVHLSLRCSPLASLLSYALLYSVPSTATTASCLSMCCIDQIPDG